MKRLLIVALLLVVPACHASIRHIATIGDQTLYESLADAHAVEQAVLCGQPSCASVTARVTPTWTDAKSQSFNRTLLPAVNAGRQFNTLLASWKPGTPMPAQLHDLITSIAHAMTEVTSDFPDGGSKTKILSDIGKAQSIALTGLDVVLMVKGGQ